MAPSLPRSSGRLEPPPPSNPFYSSTSLSSSTSDLSFSILSPRALYAQTFDRPSSVRSLPPTKFRKNMKNLTGLGTTEDEFDSLPLAVRRKYFSTLERLRFAQNSRHTALNELPTQRTGKSSLADRRGIKAPFIEPGRRIRSRRQRKVSRKESISSADASWFLTLPEKIKKQQFTREEQVILAGRLRESVILDAADEAIYKASRQPATPILDPPTPAASSRRSSSSSRNSRTIDQGMAAAMYESFRWMDEESDLDLRLALDDYHANLDGVVLPTPTSTRRPSFRRQMSISKMPFGRSSLSTIQSRSYARPDSANNHNRQKSRALSLIQPKHNIQNSVSSIDPNATHYQDPEARLKLRVYLASPQKFDEAIEFGFPSLDGVVDGANKENNPPIRSSKERTSRGLSSREVPTIKSSFATDGGISFLDDTASLFEDDMSIAEPESPVTPLGLDAGYRPLPRTSSSAYGAKSNKTSADYSHLGITKPTVVKQDGYTQVLAGSREMTLRMTLTRPDLRADETTIYGWQTAKLPMKEHAPAMEEYMDEKMDGRGPFGGIDGWGPMEKENGVVKRFWHRVRSSQRRGP
ncbi:hypothetical protein LSUE1_G004993 [Lachnellula suecica]|uniref:Mucin protein n=1 Tax=Lachnellula suecica TaxID=602035 RepID=A0A8T9CAT6_9HELO|nr:hypothetical protein LSUE1_G004993 [Lachnellula suecica]